MSALYGNRTDAQAGLTDAEFACLLFRSCGLSDRALIGALGATHDRKACGFCSGEKKVAS